MRYAKRYGRPGGIEPIPRGMVRAVSYHMTQTTPAPSVAPIERAPMHVEALTIYDAVARGQHPALRAARVPR